jgi:nucleotide-binding universal stress UspA family protein
MAVAERARVRVVTVEADLPLVAHAQTLQQKMQDYVRPLFEEKLEVDFEVLKGRPADVIPIYFKSQGCDLMIMGSHSKRGVVDTVLGNVAGALLRHIEAPVILVRPSSADVEAAKKLMIPEVPWVLPYF